MERLSSRIVYTNPWMTVREDKVRRLDGSDAELRDMVLAGDIVDAPSVAALTLYTLHGGTPC
ncbi:hypothetical protein [Phytohabitans rumicis]|uniref:Uncharacterized protein n=1 Tax=Phytohabitans rumicis TaxID=1076125 RepID=A0A6V8LJU9_9ACTN|nr:hypothetical protein [Phytohabitans rumicis]GFJ95148.1 hypothetical protein Prum_087900 [Phytohabitans rumicis]